MPGGVGRRCVGVSNPRWGYTRIQGALRSLTLESGTKIKGIRVVEGAHDVDSKVDGMGVMLKAKSLEKS